MKHEFGCQMNNKFEGWAPSDFKHLWSENIPEPRHATVLKTITVTDHFLALDKVYLFSWEQVYWWLCESSFLKSQMDMHTPFPVNPHKQKSQLLNITEKKTCDLLPRKDTFYFFTSPGFVVVMWNQVNRDTLKICPYTPCLWDINDYKMLNAYLNSKKNLLPKGEEKKKNWEQTQRNSKLIDRSKNLWTPACPKA